MHELLQYSFELTGWRCGALLAVIVFLGLFNKHYAYRSGRKAMETGQIRGRGFQMFYGDEAIKNARVSALIVDFFLWSFILPILILTAWQFKRYFLV